MATPGYTFLAAQNHFPLPTNHPPPNRLPGPSAIPTLRPAPAERLARTAPRRRSATRHRRAAAPTARRSNPRDAAELRRGLAMRWKMVVRNPWWWLGWCVMVGVWEAPFRPRQPNVGGWARTWRSRHRKAETCTKVLRIV